MVDRSKLPYLGVIGLGALFVAFAAYGLTALSGDDGLGAGFGRVALYVFLAVGVLGVIVASVDLYRNALRDE